MSDSIQTGFPGPTVTERDGAKLFLRNDRFERDGNPFGNEDADRRTTVELADVDGVECVVVRADVDWLVSAHADAAGGAGFKDGHPDREDDVQVAVPLAELRELVAGETVPAESVLEALRDGARNDSAADAVAFVSDLVGYEGWDADRDAGDDA